MDSVVGAWLLTRDKFVFVEDFGSRKITYVKLYAEAPDATEVRHFVLPEGVEIKRTLSASLEPLVQNH